MHDPVATLTAAFALYAAAGVVCLVVFLWRDCVEILRFTERCEEARSLPAPVRTLVLCLALLVSFCLLLPLVVLTWPFLGTGGRGGRP